MQRFLFNKITLMNPMAKQKPKAADGAAPKLEPASTLCPKKVPATPRKARCPRCGRVNLRLNNGHYIDHLTENDLACIGGGEPYVASLRN